MYTKTVKDFYNELKRIHLQRKVPIEKAFLLWYLENMFEKTDEILPVDGPKDGGIDAIVARKDTFYVIQSEYSADIIRGKKTSSPLSANKLVRFDSLQDTFADPKKFEEYLREVDATLHQRYRELAKKVRKEPKNVVWQLTTLHTRSRSAEKSCRNLKSANIHYFFDNLRLYELSVEGFAPPPPPLELKFDLPHLTYPDPDKKITTYVLRASVKDLIDYIDRDPNFRVLAQNVRSDLHSDINEDIKRTFVANADEFWYSHNGITIICDDADVGEEGKTILIKRPSVINGAQTLHALKGVEPRNPDARVLVRIMKIPLTEGDTKDFINDIIFRSNQQNKMFKYDLRANDLTQIKLANEFAKYKLFYERRRKEWDLNKKVYKNMGWDRIKMTDLAQILVVCDKQLGGTVIAKKNLENLFSDHMYNAAFKRPFEEIFFKYNLMKFAKKCFGKIKKKGKGYLLFTCVAIVWGCLSQSARLYDFYGKTMSTPDRFSTENKRSRALENDIRDIFSACWNNWKHEYSKNQELDVRMFINDTKWNKSLMKKLTPRFRSRIEKSVTKMFY